MTTRKTAGKDAIALLKQDHTEVKSIFDDFETAEEKGNEKKCIELARKAIEELKVHAAVEESLFYPAVRNAAEEEDVTDILEEADEEHHVAKVLIAELDLMEGTEDNFCAKFMVLAENIRHHIKEEEGEMFPKVRKLALDLDELGRRMAEKKQELKASGTPPEFEEEMVRKAGLPEMSPSKKNAKTLQL